MDRSLRAPDRGALWTRLALTRTQLAALCGVSRRQVAYWARQGILTPAPGHADRYNGDAVDLCVLLGQALRAGLPLRQAVPLARAYLAEEVAGQRHAGAPDPASLDEVAAYLRRAQRSMDLILAVLDRVAPGEG